MSKEKIDVALGGGDVDKPNGDIAFGMVKSSQYKWPNGVVPYVLSDSVSKCALEIYIPLTINNHGSISNY